MKKIFLGLVGIILGVSCSNSNSIHQEVQKIKTYENNLRNVLDLEEQVSFKILRDKQGNPYIIIFEKNQIILKYYLDKDKDGEYDEKRTLKIPRDFNLKLFNFPDAKRNYEKLI